MRGVVLISFYIWAHTSLSPSSSANVFGGHFSQNLEDAGIRCSFLSQMRVDESVGKNLKKPIPSSWLFVHATEESDSRLDENEESDSCLNKNEKITNTPIIPTMGSVVNKLINNTMEIVDDTKRILPSEVKETLESATKEVTEAVQTAAMEVTEIMQKATDANDKNSDDSEEYATLLLKRGIDESKEASSRLLNWIDRIPLPFHLILFQIQYNVEVQDTSCLNNIVVTKPRYLRDQYVLMLLNWTGFASLFPGDFYLNYVEPLLLVDRNCDTEDKFEGYKEWCRQKPCDPKEDFSYAAPRTEDGQKKAHCVLTFDPLQVGFDPIMEESISGNKKLAYELISYDPKGKGNIISPINGEYKFESLSLHETIGNTSQAFPFIPKKFLEKLDTILSHIPKSLFFFIVGTVLILNAEDIQDWAFSHYICSIIIGILFVFLLALYFIKKSEKKLRQTFPQADNVLTLTLATSSMAAVFLFQSLVDTYIKVMKFLWSHPYGQTAIFFSVTISCLLTYWFDWYSEELDESRAKGWYTYIFNGRLWINNFVYLLAFYCLSNVTPSPDYSTFLVLFIFLWDSIYYHLSWTIHYFTQDTSIYTKRVPLKQLDYGKDSAKSLEEFRLKLQRNPALMKNLPQESYEKMRRFIEDGVDVRVDEDERESWWKKTLRVLFKFAVFSAIILTLTYFILDGKGREDSNGK